MRNLFLDSKSTPNALSRKLKRAQLALYPVYPLRRSMADQKGGLILKMGATELTGGELLVPQARSALKKRRAFSVIGPSTWNELPLTLRLLPQNNVSSFCKLLKTCLFDRSWTYNASE